MSTSAPLSSWTSWSPAGVGDAVWSSYAGAVANGTAVPEAAYRAVVASVPQPQLLVALAFGLHTLFYVMTVIPAIIFPLIPFMRRYKIQKHRTVTWSDIVQCLGLVAINQIFVEIPLYCAIPLYTHYTGMPYTWESLPDWRHLLWQIPFSLIAEDAYHYWAHRLLHHPALYGRVHKIHHTYNSPFTMVAEYAHPIETMVLGTGFFVPILVLTPMIHVSFLYVWLAVRILETADVHSGYDIPWNPLRLIPFYGGATAHDLHHAKSNGNYSSTFTWWDTWCGTTLAATNYKEYSGKAITSSTVKAVRVDEKSE